MHIFHKWGRWSKSERIETAWAGATLRQARECKVCGKIQSREIAYLEQIDADGDEIGQ